MERDGQDTIIATRNLSRTYIMGTMQVPALKRVTLNIRRAEFAAIMGKSGSGKSTLLHQLGLLDTPTEGEITIDGVEISGLSESERTRFRLEKFGYVFQEYAILPELTALENVYLPAMALGLSRDECARSGMDALEKVGLAERADHRPREMSGGEQQRVAIARALINEPKILFADEPTANLDNASSKQILELFRALNRDTGQTILMVTHELEDADTVDRVIWLADGEVVAREG
ncbi:MAG: ABC transporter [Candidatus Methanogaster sp.]|uniref:ABC transporter n=1 Tax=Candidatus Methanogaster sp. TaxID=3386292 RepID=A0AC61L2G7_9EURY|nr:MAG: ABC transporter [ANME-2 cluster archaeon]